MNIKTTPFSSEMQFLLSCLNPENIEKKSFSDMNLDQDEILKLIDRHRIAPIVYHYLSKRDLAFPESFMQQLKKRYIRNAEKSLLLTSELIRLVKLFNENGIQVIAFKGPVLAYQIYGDAARRDSGDLDIFLSPDQFQQADELLQKNGYRFDSLTDNFSKKQFNIFKQLYSNLDYSKDHSPVRVEMHWRLMSMRSYFYIDHRTIFENLIEVEIGNQVIRTLSFSDHLLLLFVHGAQHGWYRLKWLCGIVHIIRSNDFSGWVDLINRAKEMGIHRSVLQGLALSKKLCNVVPQEDISRQLSENKTLNSSVDKAIKMITHIDNLTKSSAVNKFNYAIYRSLLRNDFKYKFDLLLWRFRTSRYDWQLLKLPDKLFFLYYIMRPFFLIFALMNKKYFQTKGAYTQ